MQVLATDGVWEVMDCQDVAHFVQRWRKRPWVGWSASDALTLEAQERWKLLQPEVCFSSLHCAARTFDRFGDCTTGLGDYTRGPSDWKTGLCWLLSAQAQSYRMLFWVSCSGVVHGGE